MKNNPFGRVEKIVCRFFEKNTGIFMRNGTSALWALLEALGLKGKIVVVPVNICFVVPLAIILSGNEPYFVDIDDKFTIGPESLKAISLNRVKAVIFPHMYGNTGDIEGARRICGQRDWIIIEDVAQAFGAKIGKRYAGSFADFSMTSFGMGKIIDVNIGGVLCLNSARLRREVIKVYSGLPALNEEILRWRRHFSDFYFLMADCIENGEQLYRFGVPLAYTYRHCFLSNIGSDIAFLPVLEKKLNGIQEESDIRFANAKRFQDLIRHKNVLAVRHKEGASYWRQNILVKKDRNGLLRYLRENKVKASKYFPSVDRFFYKRQQDSFGKSDLMSGQVINLWPGRETTRREIMKINSLIGKFYN